MKKRFAGIAALGMALTLAFGMTVAAAGSITTSTTGLDQAALDKVVEDYEKTITVDGAGAVTVEAATPAQEEAVYEAMKTEAVQADISAKLEEAGIRTQGERLPAIDLVPSDEVRKVLEEKGKVVLPIQSELVQSGKYYLVLHVKENGKAEVIGPVQASGKVINVEFTSFSPISLIPVGDVVDPNPGDSHWGEADSQTQTTPSGAPASPKTGEVLPIAGFMAVICLAGAVVCVRKAHN